MGGLYVMYFYVRQPDILEAKNGSRQWENLQNLVLKQI